ncbi:dihydroorotate oxidase B, catalytic subunit [Moelleriella libera RCEF 2490]|uniref:Dihydroorotate oxidase B, catalytic subunit n=1 Tax=Moelleriella libera RCEF 2490 TaxID=1081109 RepID=A0A162IBI7_9HYPO|nr:dihydroorotate oxidase B, catalytic subunit [Moelleriella libera RCEF 2490]
MAPPRLSIHPPLLNTACPWATSADDLAALLACPSTGAVTTRTSLLRGFAHDDAVHRYAFLDGHNNRTTTTTTISGNKNSNNYNYNYNDNDNNATTITSSSNGSNTMSDDGPDSNEKTGLGRSTGTITTSGGGAVSSINSFGYSPHNLEYYLSAVQALSAKRQQQQHPGARRTKTVIVSVTGSPGEVAECYARILAVSLGGGAGAAAAASSPTRLHQSTTTTTSFTTQTPSQHPRDSQSPCRRGPPTPPPLPLPLPLAMEINLSCPNIPGLSPPGYPSSSSASSSSPSSSSSLGGSSSSSSLRAFLAALPREPLIPIGIKLPPYTYAEQISSLGATLRDFAATLSFVTATNTLGMCVAGGVQGGLAGEALHPLALGNVTALRRMLDSSSNNEVLRHIAVLGVGGVVDAQGYRRMREAGAEAVGLATALGVHGVDVFRKIERQLGSEW